MACAPPHLTTHTSEPVAEPGSDAESQPGSSQVLATRSQVCLPASQQQVCLPESQQQQRQNAETISIQPPDLHLAAQTDRQHATGAGCSAKPFSDADKDSGNGGDAANKKEGLNSSSGSSRSGQHVSDDKLQGNAAAAHEASCSSSEHPPNDKLQRKATAASGSSSTTAVAAGGVQQPSRAAQQMYQHDRSEPSCVTQQKGWQQSEPSNGSQQKGSQQSEPSSVTQQTGLQQHKPSQAIQQMWQDQGSGHQAAILQAIERWACRLEVSAAGKASKPRARRHLSRRQRAHIRHAMEQQNQIDDAAGQPLCTCSSGIETGLSVVCIV